MAHEDKQLNQQTKKLHYPLNPNSYQILEQIGKGCSAIVYKALCTITSTIVAIKSINLDISTTDDNFDNIRREAKTMSLLSHPNVLKAHCCFTVGRRLWVVMPFMSAGSLQSIMASSFRNGISENCISIILKETLMGLCYLHDQGHIHRDIKAGNILMDANGSIKLADFGVSASVYESSSSSSSSRCVMLNEIKGTPYWMAPEVISSYNGYSYKADIWSFGITALELAQGKPPLSHLPLSESLVMKITKGVRYSDYQKEEEKGQKNTKFSKYFKDMVGLCLDQDPSRRPTAEKLLKHYFFKNCKGCDFLVKNLLNGLPSVELRFKETKNASSKEEIEDGDDDDDDGGDDGDDEECMIGCNVKKHRRISGWNFNVEACELDPLFSTSGLSSGGAETESTANQSILGGKTVISEKERELDVNKKSWPAGAGVDRGIVVDSLMALMRSLDDQREKVMYMLAEVGAQSIATGGGGGGGGDGGGGGKVEQLMEVIEKLRLELEDEKKMRSSLEEELEVLKLNITSHSHV